MAIKKLTTLRGISVRPIKRTDVDGLVQLHMEFETYLKAIDKSRPQPARNNYRERLINDGFGKARAFSGFIANRDNMPIGYVFYHPGYDPDEMRGRVLYVIDLYVTEKERNSGVGRLLMNAVASVCIAICGIDIYFGVWTKNKPAQAFYKKLGATEVHDAPFMHWKKNSGHMEGRSPQWLSSGREQPNKSLQ
jgi:GNAT superfamily N-acetyltransferase